MRDLALRLKTAGFHHTRGRARVGQKSLAPTLAVIVGKSIRTVERYLSDNSELNPSDDGFNKQLNKAIQVMQRLQLSSAMTAEQKSLVNELSQLIERLKQALE